MTILHNQFEPLKLLAVTERLNAFVANKNGNDYLEAQCQEDVKWLLDSHLYYYQAVERLNRQMLYRRNEGHEITWQDRAEDLERRLKAAESILWMAEKYAEAGGSGGPEMREYRKAIEETES